MSKGIFITAISIAIASTTGLAAWQFWPQTEDAQAGQQTVAAPKPAPATGAPGFAHAATWPPPFPEQTEERKYVPLLPTGPELSAAQSLVANRDSDPRTPPIARSQVSRETPSAADLADPKAYQQYEARQNAHLYAAYVQAADEEIPRLREAIARARAMGMAPAEIAKGEEKLRRIAAMQEQLRNAHPELQNAGANTGLK